MDEQRWRDVSKQVEIKHHPASDGLGPDEWYVSVRTTDNTWTFLSAHNTKADAGNAANIIRDAIAQAVRTLGEKRHEEA